MPKKYEFDQEKWDRRFEDDVMSGKLNALAEEALRDARNSLCGEIKIVGRFDSARFAE